MDQRPALERTPIAGLYVCVFGLQDKAGINHKVEHGFILEANGNGVIVACGEDLDKINRLAFDLFKSVKRPPTVTADCGLTAFGFGKAQ